LRLFFAWAQSLPMDLRSLIKLAPAMLRAPLASLLDRLEVAEEKQRLTSEAIAYMARTLSTQSERIEMLSAELAELRKSMPPAVGSHG